MKVKTQSALIQKINQSYRGKIQEMMEQPCLFQSYYMAQSDMDVVDDSLFITGEHVHKLIQRIEKEGSLKVRFCYRYFDREGNELIHLFTRKFMDDDSFPAILSESRYYDRAGGHVYSLTDKIFDPLFSTIVEKDDDFCASLVGGDLGRQILQLPPCGGIVNKVVDLARNHYDGVMTQIRESMIVTQRRLIDFIDKQLWNNLLMARAVQDASKNNYQASQEWAGTMDKMLKSIKDLLESKGTVAASHREFILSDENKREIFRANYGFSIITFRGKKYRLPPKARDIVRVFYENYVSTRETEMTQGRVLEILDERGNTLRDGFRRKLAAWDALFAKVPGSRDLYRFKILDGNKSA